MTKPITDDVVAKYQAALKAAGSFGGQIESRIDYIIRELYPKAIPEFEIDWYGYNGVSENFDGDLASSIYRDTIEISGHECKSWPDWKSPEGYVLQQIFPSIPIDYLSWEDAVVLEDIVATIAEEREKREVQALRRKEAKAKKAALAEKALSKLSEEEQKALGIKK